MKNLKKFEIDLTAAGLSCKCVNPDPMDRNFIITRKQLEVDERNKCKIRCCREFRSKFYEIDFDGVLLKCPEDI